MDLDTRLSTIRELIKKLDAERAHPTAMYSRTRLVNIATLSAELADEVAHLDDELSTTHVQDQLPQQ